MSTRIRGLDRSLFFAQDTQYKDFPRLEQIDAHGYQERQPFPWINPHGLLTDAGYRQLLVSLPDVSLFETSFGVARKNGQPAHDRYILEYHEELDLAPAWRHYIAELRSARYKDNLCRLLNQRSVVLNFHWHYAPQGCHVSPHADSIRKAGSHIFYFNTADDWHPSWGGHTVILDDGGTLAYRSSPRFADFRQEFATEAMGNRSLLFTRTTHAWHGVRPIDCPYDKLRKVFIVVINRDQVRDKLRRMTRRDPVHYY